MKNCIRSWDKRRNIAMPGDEKKTLDFAVEHFLLAYQESVTKTGAFKVALSGGSTPKAIFSLLTQEPHLSKIDWSKVHLFWSDERSVPPGHQDSNFHMAMEAGFKAVGIPSSQIHRMKAEADIEKGAKSYEELLRSHLTDGSFDYLMLGMGEDGHTASLFPGTKALTLKDKWVAANHVPQKDTWRMTLTFPCINAAKSIVLYVLGEKKQELLKEIFLNKYPSYPVEEVGTKEHPALWIVDQAAAKLLPLMED